MRLRGFLLLIIIIAAFGLLSTGGQILGFYIDWLWFREVQFTSVFLTVLPDAGPPRGGHGLAFFLILYVNVLLARRLAPRDALVAVGRRPRAAQPGDPGALLAPSGLARERAPGSHRRLGGDGSMGAGPARP